jgi:hypothetical protein
MIVANKSDRSPDLCPPWRAFFFGEIGNRKLGMGNKTRLEIRQKNEKIRFHQIGEWNDKNPHPHTLHPVSIPDL